MKHFLFHTILVCLSFILFSCNQKKGEGTDETNVVEEPFLENIDTIKEHTTIPYNTASVSIDTKNQAPGSIVNFAKTLLGVTYKYASTNPAQGFDCSGFITYVFNHFNIAVPRSSIDFTNVGTEVNLPNAAAGDLILFTGTDSTKRFVGHMGIVTENTDSVRFIHSTSGKKYGVTITTLNEYYKKRFVKVIRIFEELM